MSELPNQPVLMVGAQPFTHMDGHRYMIPTGQQKNSFHQSLPMNATRSFRVPCNDVIPKNGNNRSRRLCNNGLCALNNTFLVQIFPPSSVIRIDPVLLVMTSSSSITANDRQHSRSCIVKGAPQLTRKYSSERRHLKWMAILGERVGGRCIT